MTSNLFFKIVTDSATYTTVGAPQKRQVEAMDSSDGSDIDAAPRKKRMCHPISSSESEPEAELDKRTQMGKLCIHNL